MKYSKFDFSDVKFLDDVITIDKALKDEPSFDLPEDVLSEGRRMEISDPEVDKTNKKVGVRIRYV